MLMVVAATAVRGGESLTVLSSPVATMTAGTPTVSRPSVGSSTPTSGSSEVGTTADTDAPSTVESTTGTPPSSTDTVATPTSQPWADIVPLVLRGFAMSVIIVAAVLGNILVIISVVRHRKLRIITNYFVVSLALADLLVALCAMTFNASVELTGRWLFGSVMCDVWNSLDVYFSTASILHLCCISVDRYYAIVRPLEYPLCMTRRTVVLMLSQVWLLPALISFTPIFLGWYTTTEHSEFRKLHPHICAFVVNRAYAVVSSSVSFWIPGIVMITMYFRIYKEAIRQKRALSRTSSHILLNSVVAHHSSSGAGGASAAAAALQQYQQALQRHRSLHVGSMQFPPLQKPVDSTCCCNNARQVHEQPFENVQVVTVETENELPPKSHGVAAVNAAADLNVNGLNPRGVPMSAQQQQTSWRTEHKAARTLGVIMGAFLLCWLPFFLWYVTTSLCGEACHCPDLLVSVLFWIGYTNSALNPLIYAYFNRDFREAFKDTLMTVFFSRCCREEEEDGRHWRAGRRSIWKSSLPTHYV